jgi:hypothetical protein
VRESRFEYSDKKPVKSRESKLLEKRRLEREAWLTKANQILLVRNLNPKRYPRKSIDQVIKEQGKERIQATRIFLMRNLAPKRRQPKSIKSVLLDLDNRNMAGY